MTDDAQFDEVWAATLAVNLTAQARMVRAVLPFLAAAEGGRVVNIASTEGLIATAGITAYTASKHGVIGLTKSLAVELGRTGVTVNCVCPGPITTAMTASIPDEVKEVYARRRVPLRRYGDPEEVAHMTLSLVLPAASFVTGSIVVVDGGMTIRH
jgi:3-oxoacyl-[acyl-carrier protein] reductase